MNSRSVTSCELPSYTGENIIEVMVQSPHCIFAYWELSQEIKEMATRHFKTAWSHLSYFLRLFDVTGINFNGANANEFWEYPIPSHCSSFYFYPLKAGCTYVIDLGVKNNGEFLSLLRSGVAETPPDQVSPPQVAEEEAKLQPLLTREIIRDLPTS